MVSPVSLKMATELFQARAEIATAHVRLTKSLVLPLTLRLRLLILIPKLSLYSTETLKNYTPNLCKPAEASIPDLALTEQVITPTQKMHGQAPIP